MPIHTGSVSVKDLKDVYVIALGYILSYNNIINKKKKKREKGIE